MGAVETVSDHSRSHGGHTSSTQRIKTSQGFAYLKIHTSKSNWEAEVHGYEQWSAAFGAACPQLLAVADGSPLAVVVSELPGEILEDKTMDPEQERAVWGAAGAALVALHDLESGTHFGETDRHGLPREGAPTDGVECIRRRFSEQLGRAVEASCLTDSELDTIHAASDLIPSFEGERPTACHRDYCAANWLVDGEGAWVGVIDFEFSRWDLRVADLTRDAHWSWIRRPDLIDAFFEGYGNRPLGRGEEQMLVAHTEYAMGSILWGRENAFYGFEQEGRDALAHLARILL